MDKGLIILITCILCNIIARYNVLGEHFVPVNTGFIGISFQIVTYVYISYHVTYLNIPHATLQSRYKTGKKITYSLHLDEDIKEVRVIPGVRLHRAT